MRGRIIIAAILLADASPAMAADQQPICAARPGKATPACTVPAGSWQIETGFADWSLQKGDGERDTSLALGETTIRYGLSGRSDIEVDVTPWQRVISRRSGFWDRATGFGDISVSYKHELTRSDAPLEVAAMPFVKIPTAKHSLGNGTWEGGLLIPIAYAIPKSPLSIGLTPEVDWVADADGHGHHAAMTQVASLGWQVTPKLDISTEVWRQWDWDPAATIGQASADGAVSYLLNKDVQLDAGANFGLNRNTPDVELYTGVSIQF